MRKKKIDMLLHCKMCGENVLVKSKYSYFRMCDCGNIEVDTGYDVIQIKKTSQVRWKMKDRWIELKEEE